MKSSVAFPCRVPYLQGHDQFGRDASGYLLCAALVMSVQKHQKTLKLLKETPQQFCVILLPARYSTFSFPGIIGQVCS